MLYNITGFLTFCKLKILLRFEKNPFFHACSGEKAASGGVPDRGKRGIISGKELLMALDLMAKSCYIH